MIENNSFDVIIIGGSNAGLSATMALGRSKIRTLAIDSDSPNNQQTTHSHNFLTRDGETPNKISKITRESVEQYETVTFYSVTASAGIKSAARFEIKTQQGESFYGNKLTVASGIKDEVPKIYGFYGCWGISVIHCPFL